MTRTIKVVYYILALSLISVSCSTTKKALKAYELGEFQKTIDYYSIILEKNQLDPDANYYTAEAYRRSNRPKEAEEYYRKALSAGIRNDTIRLNYAYSLKSNSKYDEAKIELQKVLNSNISEEIRKRVLLEEENLNELDVISETLNYYRVKNLEEINTSKTEYSPVYKDGFLYFTSNRENDKIYAATGAGYTNLYQVKTEGAIIDPNTVTPLSEAINTFNINEGTITFSPDGKTMIFARGNGKKKKSGYDVDLYMSRSRNGQWTAPTMLGTAVNDPLTWESTPAFSSDGRTLYFASDRPGGFGGIDLYSVRMTSRGRFSNAKNLGPEINTPGDELFPFISDDGNLYFSSDGHPGFGGLDIFVVNRNSGLLKVKNLGYPMNSSADDFGIYFFKADRGFFASNRDGGKGNDDIYTFLNQDPDLKIVNYYLAGTTMTPDKDGNLVILPNTTVKLLDFYGEVLDETETSKDGKFNFRVFEHERYTLIGEKKTRTESFLTTRLPFTTVGRAVDRSTLIPLVTDITFDTVMVMEKQEMNKVFVLDNIYYDLDRWEIRPDAAIELDKLVLLLQDNPEIKIELSSHTDSRQSDAYNNKLSDRRARSAVEYLVQQGIDQKRLVARGYGESKPFKIKDAKGNEIILTENYIESFEDVDKREELHQLNRRTEFKILEIKETEFNEDKYFDDQK